MIGEQIKKGLVRCNQNTGWLTKETKISSGTISLYINNKSKPGAEQLIKIADALGVSIDWLCGRTDNPEVNK